MGRKTTVTEPDVVSQAAAARVRRHLLAAGMTQKEFAPACGVEPPQLSRLMTGRGVRVETLRKVAAALETTIDDLIAPLPLEIFGHVPCGPPLPAIDGQGVDTLNVRKLFPQEDVFVLRASGKSMTGRGILSGDYVLVKKAEAAQHGQAVVAEVDGDLVLKGYVVRAGKGKLVGTEEGQSPRAVDGETVKLVGIVVGVIRKY